MMRARLRLASQFFISARTRGVFRTVQIALYELWFDYRFGRSTGIVIPVRSLDYDDEDAECYFPSSYLFLTEIFRAIDCTDRVIIDFGCGMGRVLIFACTLPFARVIGVEMSKALCEAARRNLAKQKRCEIVHADARYYQIPDDADLFYLANPFEGPVVNCVLDNIEQSLQRRPRVAHLIYSHPVHDQLVTGRGFASILNTRDYKIYRVPQPASR